MRLRLAAAAALLVAAMAPLMTPVSALAEIVPAQSAVVAARVYPQGATVTRRAVVSAPEGRHAIRLDDLPLAIDPATLRADLLAGADARVLGLSFRQVAPPPSETTTPERLALEAAIRDVEWAMRAADDAVDAAAARLEHLRAFRAALLEPGEDLGGAALIERLDALPSVWSRLDDAEAAAAADRRAAAREVETLDRRLDDLRARLAALAPPAPTTALFVDIEAAAPLDAVALEVRYLIGSASWRPVYDVRLDESGDAPALSLVRRAAVSQRTGEDWMGVALTLSTAQPSGTMQAFDPDGLLAAFEPEPEFVGGGGLSSLEAAPADREQFRGRFLEEDSVTRALSARPALVAASPDVVADLAYEGAAVAFTAPAPADLSGDGETAQIALSAADIEPALEVRTSPAVEEAAYLYAVFTNDGTPILPGRASIFRDGAFVGRVAFGETAAGAEAALPLGPEEAIRVQRTVLDRRQGEEGFFSTANRQRARFEIRLENLGARVREVRVLDATPFTEESDIEVALTAAPPPADRAVDGKRGILAWRVALEPGAAETIAVGYDLTWPEGRSVNLRRVDPDHGG